MRLRYLPFALAAAGALSACSDPLNVENVTAPNVGRILSTPDGIEGLFRTSFQQVHQATHGTTTSLYAVMQAMAGESYATVANFGMAQYSAIPRPLYDNSRGNQIQSEANRDFSVLSRNSRNVANGIRALDALIAGGGSLGSAQSNARARAWGWFVLAVAHGNLSLVYDQATVSTPSLAGDEVPELVPYGEVNAAALAFLDSALAVAATPAATGMSIPNEWFRLADGSLNQAQFVQLVRSYKARFRAGAARNPTERAAVDWAQVAADAAAGITTDVTLGLATGAGWTFVWLNQALVNSTWSSVPMLYAGFADTSGNFRKWILPPLADSDAPARQTGGDPGDFFLVHTPDTRYPSGANRAAQVANSPVPAAGVMPDIYFRARNPGDDTQGLAWGESPYDFVRFSSYRAGSSVGNWVLMSATEIAMLAAEADLRLNPNAPTVAVTRINASRVANGLPAFPTGATRETRAPAHPGGGALSCVPQTPTAGNRVVECGTLWEAMKYEKRLESMFTGYAQWWSDHRGWGDLVQGTLTMIPVPYQEMDARVLDFYNSTPEWASGPSTYSY